MNNKGITLIELVVSVAIIMILASIAVPVYGDFFGIAKRSADDASVLVLNDATIAYAMLNDIPLDEVFSGISNDEAMMKFLVDEKYLMKEVDPAQEEETFEWDAVNLKWTISSGQDAGNQQSGSGDSNNNDQDHNGNDDQGQDQDNDDDDEDHDGDDGDDDEDDNDGNGNGGHRGQWRWRHGHGWQWYDENGNNTGEDEVDSHFEVYGYGGDYDEGTKVWYNGEYYISHKNTKKIPGKHKDWQKVTDEWFEYNSYEEGDVITYNGVQYEAKKSSNGKDPSKKKSHWKKIG